MHLSIILPCYKVEKYIVECLDSLYNQDILEQDFEVICVNDCSPDGTRDIILAYKEKYKNIVLIDHSVNKKQGGARNTGILAATGDLIWFVDPDDFIKPNSFKKVINIFENNNIDLVYFDYSTIALDGALIRNNFLFKNYIHEGKEVFDYEESWKIIHLAWSRVIKRTFLIENQIFFVENFNYEDVIFGLQCFLYSKKVLYDEQIHYYYRQNLESTMHRKVDGQVTASLLNVAVSCHELSNLSFISEKDNLFFESVKFFYLKSIFKLILYLSNEERSLFYEKIKEIKNRNILIANSDIKTRIALKHIFVMNYLSMLAKILKKIKNLF